MADLIKIKGGRGAVPTLQDRELAYSKDEVALYIGTENGNIKLCGVGQGADEDAVKVYIDGLVADINTRLEAIEARLDALETPKE